MIKIKVNKKTKREKGWKSWKSWKSWKIKTYKDIFLTYIIYKMVIYTCPTCNKEFNKKSNFIEHTQLKKKPCRSIIQEPPRNHQEPPRNHQEPPRNHQEFQELLEKNTEPDNQITKSNTCIHCGLTFTRKDALKRHIDLRCKAKKLEEDEIVLKVKDFIKMEKENAQLKNEVEELKKLFFEFSKNANKTTRTNKKNINQTINTQNNTNIETQNNTNNTQNNINIILPYGKELENIKLNEVLDHMVVRDFDNMLPKLVKYIYLNKDKPQNQNFVVNDIARNKCQYYDGEKWITGKANDQILKLFENTNSLITDAFDRPELEKTLKFINENKKYQSKINTILENKTFAKSLFDESDKENLDKRQEILDELKLIFYSHKDEILKISL